MTAIKKLPDAEFEIMNIVWQLTPPVTSGMLMEQLNRENRKVWKMKQLSSVLLLKVTVSFTELLLSSWKRKAHSRLQAA